MFSVVLLHGLRSSGVGSESGCHGKGASRSADSDSPAHSPTGTEQTASGPSNGSCVVCKNSQGTRFVSYGCRIRGCRHQCIHRANELTIWLDFCSLGGMEWEYGLIVEKRKSGYGNAHCTVLVAGEVNESDFYPAIDAHLHQCEIVHGDAHNYHADNKYSRLISIRSVNPSLNSDDLDSNGDDIVGNVGSYIGEYIGVYGEPLFDRGLNELQFRAAVWAPGTQVVRLSEGRMNGFDANVPSIKMKKNDIT